MPILKPSSKLQKAQAQVNNLQREIDKLKEQQKAEQARRPKVEEALQAAQAEYAKGATDISPVNKARGELRNIDDLIDGYNIAITDVHEELDQAIEDLARLEIDQARRDLDKIRKQAGKVADALDAGGYFDIDLWDQLWALYYQGNAICEHLPDESRAFTKPSQRVPKLFERLMRVASVSEHGEKPKEVFATKQRTRERFVALGSNVTETITETVPLFGVTVETGETYKPGNRWRTHYLTEGNAPRTMREALGLQNE